MEGAFPEILLKWYHGGMRNLPVSGWDESFYREVRHRVEEAEKTSDQFRQQGEKQDLSWLSVLLSVFQFPIRVGSLQLLTSNYHIEISILLMSAERYSRLLDCFPMEYRHAVAEDIWEPLLFFSRIPKFCLGIPVVLQNLRDVDFSKWSSVNADRIKRVLEEQNKELHPEAKQSAVSQQQSSSSTPQKPSRTATGNYSTEKEEYLDNHRKHVEEFEKSYKFRDEVKSRMKIENADLFSSKQCLAHCVSEDMSMSAGIAKIFVKKFPSLPKICWEQYVLVGGVAVYEDRKLNRFVYNLVTKKYFNDKPLYPDFIRALEAMRKHACQNAVTEISIPQIGCGLDGLNWEFVSRLIDEIFDDSGVQITVYIIDGANRGSGPQRAEGGSNWSGNSSGRNNNEQEKFNSNNVRGDVSNGDTRGAGRGRGRRQNDENISGGNRGKGRGTRGGGASRGY